MTNRDIGQEILDSIVQIKSGQSTKKHVSVPTDIVKVRKELQLSQAAFSSLMGVSVRTLQEWEQGRRRPTGPACSLLRIAAKHPEAFIDI